jgi:hypothetical protein
MKIQPHLHETLWRGLQLGAVHREAFYHPCCGFLSWMNSNRGSKNCCYTLSYAVDIAILISAEFPNSVSELLLEALGTEQQRSDRTQLSVNYKRR